MYTFVFEDGKVLTIKAKTKKEAMQIIDERWYKDIFYIQNFTCYVNTGYSL